MALYDYRCPDGHVREVRHGMNEAVEVRCPAVINGDGTENAYIGQDITEGLFGNTDDLVRCGKSMDKVVGAVDFIPCRGMRKFDDRLPPIKVDGKPYRA